MFVERKTRIDLRNRGSETGRDLPGAHRVLGSYGTLGDKVCVCVCGGGASAGPWSPSSQYTV